MTNTRNPGNRRPTGPERRPAGRESGGERGQSRTIAGIIPLKRIFTAESGNYFLLLGTTLFLVGLGLVMVLSASFVEGISKDENPFGVFVRQSLYAVIGIPAMLIAARMPVSFWKRWSWPAVIVGVGLQLLVFTPLGYESGGNRNWITVGGVNAQPSELVKLALVVWIAWVLTAKKDLLHDWKHVAVPIAPVAGVAIGLVLLGNDLGSASILLVIILGLLYFAGVRLRFIAAVVASLAVLGYLAALASPSRVERIRVWMEGCSEGDYSGYCWQTLHGTWALAAGGWFGAGLGNSKATWLWLPEAENDFIFAIIGEELGLVGAMVVLLMFVVLAIAFVRIIRSTTDDFSRIATSGVMIWVIGQAFVNIGVVLGVLPVLGVPLPLISAGGSALITTLFGIGVVLSFARHKRVPGAPDAPMSAAERSRLAAAQRARQAR